MTAPPVSVVVPCHNREKTARRAIQSVLDQSYRNIEVIAVDDASRDNTSNVLATITDPRFSFLTLRANVGAAGARNAGAALAKAQWIAFQDSDDVWHPEKLERQMAELEGSDAVACYCAMTVHQDGIEIGEIPTPTQTRTSGKIADALLADSFISTQTVIIRSDVFAAISGMDANFRALDDWDLMLRVAQKGPIAFVPAPLVDQHMSENSITNDKTKRVFAQIQFLEKHYAKLVAHPRVLALHRNRIAGGLRQLGQPGRAMSHAVKALQTAPGNPRYLAQVLRCLVSYFWMRHRPL
ncbi:MAG: glycosyltransferase [Pseudomonadota bacterium]